MSAGLPAGTGQLVGSLGENAALSELLRDPPAPRCLPVPLGIRIQANSGAVQVSALSSGSSASELQGAGPSKLRASLAIPGFL